MLTSLDLAAGQVVRRPIPSLNAQYDDYVMQRVEAFKNGLNRAELLQLGQEATDELHAGSEDQFVLTEILMADLVDRMIRRRLHLPSFKKWRKQALALREAQRQPIHWSIPTDSALVALLPRLEPEDSVLVVGGGVIAEACLLAAWDVTVTFVDEDLAAVDQAEARVVAESLSSRFMAFVASLGEWLPPGEPADLVVVDAGTLANLTYPVRRALARQLQSITRPAGTHVVLPGSSGAAPEAYLSHYPGWERERLSGSRKGRASKSRGVVLSAPPVQEQEGELDGIPDAEEGDRRRGGRAG